ncbi:GNAT family N-acetyltransferase [Geomonas sp. RF6]|uniref:GNAT family N-acetyltransferase n=1 Tax=Geomonas sp. RF6 TaxID=2897342 RepID=UPI001E40C993|nr:GNAT family N-acetyltransferase [Geomonas sp. RF6]UFS69131.1 GNAT family N-acetyltransferase [Geomonas sp. RF6]
MTSMRRIRSLLGQGKRYLFTHNSAMWFCGAAAGRAQWRPAEGIRIEFDDFAASCVYLQKEAARFPWIAPGAELEAARRWGHHYPLIYRGGTAAGYIKIALQKVYVQDFDALIPLKDDEAFVCDTYIAPEFRGKGLSRELVLGTLGWLAQSGGRYLFCHIPEWNAASLKLYTGCGFLPVKKISHLRVCGCRYFTTTPEEVLAAGRLLHGHEEARPLVVGEGAS